MHNENINSVKQNLIHSFIWLWFKIEFVIFDLLGITEKLVPTTYVHYFRCL